MSSAGQIVGGLIGGVVGTFTPAGTFLGAQLGMMLGGYIDPGKGTVEEGPRLSDLTVQTSTYGAVIPDLYGTDAVSGNVFWLQGNKIDETPVKKKTGGKGGQKKTTVTWVNTATFAIGLCRGPVVGVRRIWLGGELYYDAGSSDPGTIAASNAAAEGFKVYLGTDTQDADPRIQADLGVANTPAWRGRAYIVFYDLDLAKYSGSLIGVQAKVEVMQLGAIYDYPVVYTSSSSHLWKTPAWNGAVFCSVSQTSHHVKTSPDGITWTTRNLPSGLGSPTWHGVSAAANGVFILYGSVETWRSGDNGVTWSLVLTGESVLNVLHSGSYWLLMPSSGGYAYLSSDGVTWTPEAFFTSSYVYQGSFCWDDVFSVWILATYQASDVRIYTSPTALAGSWTLRKTYVGDESNFQDLVSLNGRTVISGVGTVAGAGYGRHPYVSTDGGITWQGYPASMLEDSLTHDGTRFFSCYEGGFKHSSDGIEWSGVTAWPWAFPTSVLMCKPPTSDAGIAAVSAFSEGAFIYRQFVAGDTATLGDIVAAKCLQSGLLTSSDIDVAQLTDSVRGYTDSSTGSIRDSLSPLQTAWPFDVRQRGYKLEFVRRGGASVRTIDANDMDARGPSTSPGVKITQAREMNLQLPRSVTVNHKDYDREYAVGEQYAERLSTDAVNEVGYELPIVMTASEAAQKADILLYLAWMERVDLSFSLPNTYLNLEPGDVISLPVNGSLASVRVVSLTYTSDCRIEVTGKFASASTYVSSAVGVTTLVTAQTTLSLPGATEYVLLDVPILHTAQLDPSFLVSMYGGSSWEGGVLMRSDDSGSTWADLQAFSSPGSTAGSATSVIGVVDSRVWDNASVLSVGMTNGDLFSVTAEAVLNGSNYFAYGDDGRWEIIGVQNCTLVSADTYKLQDMLRGRFGTEWAMSTHQVGDNVVLLSVSDVTAVGMNTSSIGLSRVYRGVTLDADISTASDRAFTYNGVNLKPYAPVHLHGARVVSSYDWMFTWVARSRTDGEWRDGVSVAISEPVEAYELVVYSGDTYTTIKRTISVSTPVATYTEAQQITDFGGAQTNVYVRVYQLSSVVGQGYAAEKSIIAQGGFIYWGNVVLQLGMQGANNSTTFTDERAHTVTPVGNAKISATQSQFGSSAYFDGSGDYYSIPATSDFNLGSGAMTIEFWVYRVSGPTYSRVLMFGPNGSSSSCQLNLTSDGSVWFFPAVGSPASGYSVGAGSYTLNTWQHIAIVQETATMFAIYVNGVQKGRGAGGAFPSTTYTLKVGGDTSLDLSGNIRQLRITKGVARYMAAFPVPTAPYEEGAADPYWANVVLSMPLTTGAGFVDTKGKSVTVSGNTIISSARDPFRTSAYFDGSGDYLALPTSSDWAFGTGDFCVEAWVFVSSLPGGSADNDMTVFGRITTDPIMFCYIDRVTGKPTMWNNSVSVASSTGITLGTWNHVAWTRASGTMRIFLNGSLCATQAGYTTDFSATTEYNVGGTVAALRYFNGYIGPMRVTEGVPVYISSFTPPTAPFPTF